MMRRRIIRSFRVDYRCIYFLGIQSVSDSRQSAIHPFRLSFLPWQIHLKVRKASMKKDAICQKTRYQRTVSDSRVLYRFLTDS